jgi:hypothetical protein
VLLISLSPMLSLLLPPMLLPPMLLPPMLLPPMLPHCPSARADDYRRMAALYEPSRRARR